jgi:hypothetical protein
MVNQFLNIIIIISSEGARNITACIEIIRTRYAAMGNGASKHKIKM